MNLVLIFLTTSCFVYYDATKNKIGTIQGEKGFLNMPAGGWAVASIFLWIIVFPIYLFKRKELINKANENPVEPPRRNLKLGILIAIFTLVSINNYQKRKKIQKLNKALDSVQSKR